VHVKLELKSENKVLSKGYIKKEKNNMLRRIHPEKMLTSQIWS
jgi:hypothetical protein